MSKRGNPAPGPHTTTSAFTPPYPPSWFDRFTSWVDRLPGPAWAFYVVLGVGLALTLGAIAWREGVYSPGTFNAGLVFTGASLAYVLALMHYLDKAASSSIAASTASFMIVFIAANGLVFLLVYHTFHQLVHISRIYTHHARIDIYELQPLYALSLPGAYTALGLFVLVHSLYSLSAISLPSAQASPVGIGPSLVLAGIAVATFALPLLGAHRRLVAEKRASLAEVSSRFRATTIKPHRQLDRGSLVQMDQLNKALASLQTEQDVLRKIPTWPWEPGALRAVVAALLVPVAVWIIEQLLARVLRV